MQQFSDFLLNTADLRHDYTELCFGHPMAVLFRCTVFLREEFALQLIVF